MSSFTDDKLRVDYFVDTSSGDLPAALLDLASLALPSWKEAGLETSQISLTATSGNLTNRIWIVRAEAGSIEGQVILVRVFGEGTSEYISREKEEALMESLKRANFPACECLAFFSNGRIEKYIDGKDLEPLDFSDNEVGPIIARSMARTLGRLHSLKTDFAYKEESIISKALQFLSMAESIAFPSELDKGKRDQLRDLDLPKMKAAFLSTHAKVMTMVCTSSQQPALAAAVGLSIIHGDLLCGNVMVDAKTSLQGIREGYNGDGDGDGGSDNDNYELKLWLIDMEYSGMGCPAYDIGNHFNEWMGYDVDTSLFPARDTRQEFYRHYIANRHDIMGDSDDFLETFDECVLTFSQLSHLYWGLWAITLSTKDPAPMDYLDYARLRFAAYRAMEKA